MCSWQCVASTRSLEFLLSFGSSLGILGFVEHLGEGPVALGLVGSLVIAEPEAGEVDPFYWSGSGRRFQMVIGRRCECRWALSKQSSATR